MLRKLLTAWILTLFLGQMAWAQATLSPHVTPTVIIPSPVQPTVPTERSSYTTPPLHVGPQPTSLQASEPGALTLDPNDPRLKAIIDRLVDDRLKATEEAKTQSSEPKKQPEEKVPEITVGQKLTGGSVSWKNGFWFETPDKDFTLHVGGTVQYDLGFYTNSPSLVSGPRSIGVVDDGANVRRGRLRTEGRMWEVIDYRFELEFFNAVTPPGAAPGVNRLSEQQTFVSPGPTDAWITITQLPVIGNVRVGNQKEPIGLDHLESYRFLPFMERSPLFDFNTATAFNNGFTPGIMLFNTAFDERMTWAIGGFKNSYSGAGFSLGDGQFAATGRLTALPYYADDGRYLVHLGIAGSHRDPVFEQDRFRVRPSIRSAPGPSTPFLPILIDTGFFTMDSQDILALEFFANYGRWSFQAEYMGSWNSGSVAGGAPIGTTFFQGYYVQALYWLTGEYTRWDKKAAAPDRYIPSRPFFFVDGENGRCFGPGAWQVGVRYSNVDTNNRGINGGMLNDLTLGLNWILNPNVKFQWNYEYAHRYGVGPGSNGDFQGIGMRVHFDF